MAASDEGLGLEGEAEAPHETQKNTPKMFLVLENETWPRRDLKCCSSELFRGTSKQTSKQKNKEV